MFRMTHLFEQHGKNWFIECGENEAGELLGKLPLSRDLQIILSKKMALMRSVNAMGNKITEDLNLSKKIFIEFEELIHKNAQLSSGIPKDSLSDIILGLNSISEAIKFDIYNGDEDVNQVSLYSETLKSKLIQVAHKQKVLNDDLIILKERMKFFTQNSQELSDKGKKVSELLEAESNAKKDEEQTEKSINNRNDNIEKLKEEIARDERLVLKFNEIEKCRDNLSFAKLKLKEDNNKLENVKKIYNEQVDFLENNEKLKDEHKLINESIIENREQFLLLNQKKEYLQEWEKLLTESENLNKELLAYCESKITITKTKLSTDEKATKAEESYQKKKQNLDNLNSAAEAVQNAVSEIRKHLHKNQTNCPVCQAEYAHEELMVRIEKSLNSMNPMISDAIKEERSAYEELQNALKEQFDSTNELNSIIQKTKNIQDKIEENNNRINSIRVTHFQGMECLKEAAEYLKKEYESNSNIFKELDNKKNLMKEVEPVERVNKINLGKLENERIIKELFGAINNLEKDISFAENRVNNLENELSGIKSDDLTEKAEVIKNYVASEEIKMAESKKHLIQIRGKINLLQQQILSEKDSISKIYATQTSIINQWDNAGLKGEPNIPDLEKFSKYLHEEISRINDFMKKMYDMKEILAKWRMFEEYKVLE